MVESGRSPILSAARLRELGFTLAIYPATAMLAMAAALEAAFDQLKVRGQSNSGPGLVTLQAMHNLTGFPTVWALEEKWTQEFDE